MNMIQKGLRRIFGMAEIDSSSQIGGGTYIGRNSIVVNSTIGKYCSIGPGVKIGLYDHYLTPVSTHPFLWYSKYGYLSQDRNKSDFDNKYGKRPPIIGNDVWIASDVNIVRGVTIGDGAVIGAGAIVTKDIPPYAIAVGNPAHVLRYRFSQEEIRQLLEIKWWNWPKDELMKAIPHMYEVHDFIRYCASKNVIR